MLDTDDDTPAAEYTYEARRLLAEVAASLEEATHIAKRGTQHALAHLKISEPPS